VAVTQVHELPLELVVIRADTVVTCPLPRSGQVSIGRTEDNHIRLDDPSVSRRHAILHLGPPLRIEDLGSSNGIRVTLCKGAGDTAKVVEKRVPRRGVAEIGMDHQIELGSTRLFLQYMTEADDDEKPASSRVIRDFSVPVIHDAVMREIYEMVDRVARSEIAVLLLGETGVGKEVMAESIHRHSARAQGPLVCLNCAALHESLLESELFGHEAGAFTGATKTKPGLFEIAAGGTVFLDEVGELPLSTQVKLLRVLEERKVLRVGGLQKRDIDVRFVSATNRDLDAGVMRGAFRQDLYFRLNGITLVIPPLRERVSEIEALARNFMFQAATKMKLRTAPLLSQEALDTLLRYSWPGNIRELRNVIERAVVLSGGDAILPSHLGLWTSTSSPPAFGMRLSSQAPPARPSSPSSAATTLELPTVPIVETVTLPPRSPSRSLPGEDERQRILDALDRCGGNQTQAAEMLGMSRRTLVSRLSLYGIPRPRKKE